MRLCKSAIAAAHLDCLLSSVEGSENLSFEHSEEVRVGTKDEYLSFERNVFREAKALESNLGRYTPLGLPTDDSQILISGIMAKLLLRPDARSGEFTTRYLNTWREFNSKQVWRNTGPRMQRFFNQADESIDLSGPFSTGDMLRAYPFLFFSSELNLIVEEFRIYAAMVNLLPEQKVLSIEYLRFLHSIMLDNKEVAQGILKTLIDGKQDYPPMQDMFRAMRDYLIGGENIVSYIKEASARSKDFDTIGFLGGRLL